MVNWIHQFRLLRLWYQFSTIFCSLSWGYTGYACEVVCWSQYEELMVFSCHGRWRAKFIDNYCQRARNIDKNDHHQWARSIVIKGRWHTYRMSICKLYTMVYRGSCDWYPYAHMQHSIAYLLAQESIPQRRHVRFTGRNVVNTLMLFHWLKFWTW